MIECKSDLVSTVSTFEVRPSTLRRLNHDEAVRRLSLSKSGQPYFYAQIHSHAGFDMLNRRGEMDIDTILDISTKGGITKKEGFHETL
jgi:hypothetical protein